MNTEEKYNLAMLVILKSGFNTKDAVQSIADCIEHNRFLIHIFNGEMILFLTWHQDLIEGNKHIFFNNLWIDPDYREFSSLLRLRKIFRYLLKDVKKYYWFNSRREKVINRR